MDRATKELLVKEYTELFSSAVTGVLVDYKGLNVEELTELRKTLFEKGSRFRVLKNSLAKIAATGTPFENLVDQFVETRALVYSKEDVAAPAKIVTDAAKKNEKIKLISGLLVSGEKGEVLDNQGVKALGNLPSKEELLTKLLFVMNAPITNFARTLNEVPAKFVRTLQAVADSKE
ncbi:MAG: 50S ribosomal protein L10 [Proteobacteria bacterium]|nr:50S ribosomal protein L10 [Pseudomonadota bacterium]